MDGQQFGGCEHPMKRNALPAELSPAQVVAIVDTREQAPFDLAPLQMVEGSLTTGDYSFRGGEDVCRIERKSIADLVQCCGRERERFEREVERLFAFPSKALVIEGSWDDIERGDWRAQVSPKAVAQSLLSWISRGLPVVLPGNRERAADFTARLLFLSARRQYRSARAMVEGLTHPEEEAVA
jgi:ERCC4-type nuclease